MRPLTRLAPALLGLVAMATAAAGPAAPGPVRHEGHQHAPSSNDEVAELRSAGPLAFAPQGLTEDRFEVATQPESIHVRAHDGVSLYARLFRPDTSADPTWRPPVVLVHSPYYAGSLLGSNDRSMDLVEFLTPKGYAVALTDVRGTGNSGGCASQDGLDQARDFKTLVEWFAAQPWGNGRVGSYGKSYDAETQNAGAVLAPQGLATMVTVAGISGLYDVAFYDGVPLGTNGVLSAAVYVPFSVGVPTDPEAHPGQLRTYECQPANFAGPANMTGDMTAYWQEREFRLGVHDVPRTTSVLHVHGLHDGIVTPIAIDGWYDDLPGFRRAIWGQWEHHYPYDAPDTMARDDWYDTIHAWFDHFLLDLDTGVTAWPPVQVQAEDFTWRAVDAFATMGADRSLALGSDGVLGGAVADGATVPVGEDAPTSWMSTPFDRDVHLTGRAVLDAVVTIDRPDAHFALVLEAVGPDGRARKLTEGWRSAMHRDGLEAGQLVPVGEEVRYRIRTYPFDAFVLAGESLRLRLSGDEGAGEPAHTDWSGTVLANGESVLHFQVEDAPCGVLVASREEPFGDTAGCPAGIPRRGEGA